MMLKRYPLILVILVLMPILAFSNETANLSKKYSKMFSLLEYMADNVDSSSWSSFLQREEGAAGLFRPCKTNKKFGLVYPGSPDVCKDPLDAEDSGSSDFTYLIPDKTAFEEIKTYLDSHQKKSREWKDKDGVIKLFILESYLIPVYNIASFKNNVLCLKEGAQVKSVCIASEQFLQEAYKSEMIGRFIVLGAFYGSIFFAVSCIWTAFATIQCPQK